MTFDKSKVYTAVNADELQVGSWCAFADTLAILKENVEQEYAEEIVDIKDEREEDRFVLSNGNKYSLVYLLGFPTDPKYKPFSNIEKAREIISKHGGWVRNIKLVLIILLQIMIEKSTKEIKMTLYWKVLVYINLLLLLQS